MGYTARQAVCVAAAAILLCLAAPAAAIGCPAGTGGVGCQPCPAGSWAPAGKVDTPCTPCPTGFTTAAPKAKSKTACLVCAPGYASPMKKGKFVCASCPVGFYSTGGASKKSRLSCTQCPPEFTTAAPGGAHCSVPVCPPGMSSSGDPASCATPCPQGFWSAGGSPTDPQPACQACQPGFTTGGSGTGSAGDCGVLICPPGTGKGRAAFCSTCIKGTWSAGGSLTSPQPACSACPSGMTTTNEGAASDGDCKVAVCSAGSTGSGSSATCSPCARGMWSAAGSRTAPQPACQACPPATTTPFGAVATSADNCTVAACVVGDPALWKSATPSTLNTRDCLLANTCMLSPGGRAALCMQADRNVVLWGTRPVAPGAATACPLVKLWESGTATAGVFTGTVCMKNNGFFEMYDRADEFGSTVWLHMPILQGRNVSEGPFSLQLSDNCQAETLTRKKVSYWSTGTAGKCPT